MPQRYPAFEAKSLNHHLCPPVDSQDKYDPVLVGMARKRQCPPPEGGYNRWEDRGKRSNSAQRRHQPLTLPQNHIDIPDSKFNGGSVQATRFSKGFMRRQEGCIGQDAQRAIETEIRDKRLSDKLQFSRDHFFETQKGSAFNPINGGPPIGAPASMQTASTLTSETRSHRRKAPQAIPSEEKTAEQAVRKEARQQRLAAEGLSKPRQWSVRQQLQSWDGFVLPAIHQ